MRGRRGIHWVVSRQRRWWWDNDNIMMSPVETALEGRGQRRWGREGRGEG